MRWCIGTYIFKEIDVRWFCVIWIGFICSIRIFALKYITLCLVLALMQDSKPLVLCLLRVSASLKHSTYLSMLITLRLLLLLCSLALICLHLLLVLAAPHIPAFVRKQIFQRERSNHTTIQSSITCSNADAVVRVWQRTNEKRLTHRFCVN
jgi:hypothetical protein